MSDPTVDMNSRIDRIEVTLSHAVDAIEKLADAVNRPQKTQWGPILTAVSLLFVAGGGYTTLITMPIQRESDMVKERMMERDKRELELSRELGRVEGTVQMMQEKYFSCPSS